MDFFNTNKKVDQKLRTGFKKVFFLFLTLVFLFTILSFKTNIIKNCFVDVVDAKGNKKDLNKGSDYIFNQNLLHTFELTLPKEALKKIDSDPSAEEYVEGSLKFNGRVLKPVGIRYKGSIGAFVNALSGKDWANPSVYKTATKISMKVKINWNDPARTFYGLKKLQFHSQNHDGSQMHERLGYWLFREMGVVAPRSVHARLVINGRYNGIYALTEQIDEQFIARNFKDASGNLYKEVWPINYQGKATDQKKFIKKLKTNKSKDANVNIIKDFADAIVNANDDNLRKLIIERMDLDQIISYIVVDRMIRNDDGAFHWYCRKGKCNNHNYYWYEEPSTQKIYLIPWDLNSAFKNIGSEKSSVTRIFDKWGEISNNCIPFPTNTTGLDQKSAACDKLTKAWASFGHEYDSIKMDFNNGPFSEDVVYAKISKWSEQIREATREAKKMHQDALEEKKWDEELNLLKSNLKHSRLNY